MGLVEAVKSFYRRYTDFKTRSARSEFWWVMLFNTVVGMILAVPFMGAYMQMVTEMSTGGTPDVSGVFGVTAIPYFLFALINFIPGIALVVRRLHDLDKSGWWYLGFLVLCMLPLIGLIAVIVFIVFMCRRGTVGPNRFGADPLGASAGTFD